MMEYAEVNILDGFIGLLIALLILSIINEKLSTFLRANTFYVKRLLIFISGSLLYVLWCNSPAIFEPEPRTKGFFIFWFVVSFIIVLALYNSSFYTWILGRSWMNGILKKLFTSKKPEEIKVVDKLKHIINGVPAFLGFLLISKHYNEALGGCGFIVGAYSFFLLAVLTLSLQSTLKGDILINIAKSKKQSDSQKKDEIDQDAQSSEIDVLSLITGFFIAFAFRADIFGMFKAATSPDGLSELNWGAEKFPLVINGNSLEFTAIKFDSELELVGILITGFFLSFGSKFFHDLLDNLLQIKNLKRKLNDKESYTIQSIEEFDEYINLTSNETAKLAIKQNIHLRSLPNVRNVLIGTKREGEKVIDTIDFHLTDADRSKIPEFLPLELTSGKSIKVKTQVYESVSIPSVQFAPSDALYLKRPVSTGTFGCILEDLGDQRLYALTCSHVITGGSSINLKGNLSGAQMKRVFKSKTDLRQWSVADYAIRNSTLDIALIGPILNMPNTFGTEKINSHRAITENDIKKQIPVKIHGAKSKGVGVLKNVANEPVKIKYSDDEKVEMIGLLVFSKLDDGSDDKWQSISKSGDSGAIITDEKNHPIALLVAGNNTFSYGIPMTTIFDHLYMKIAGT